MATSWFTSPYGNAQQLVANQWSLGLYKENMYSKMDVESQDYYHQADELSFPPEAYIMQITQLSGVTVDWRNWERCTDMREAVCCTV